MTEQSHEQANHLIKVYDVRFKKANICPFLFLYYFIVFYLDINYISWMKKWQTTFETHTRHDVIATCHLLAQNMTFSKSDHQLRIFIGGLTSIGKSLIADSLIESLSHTPKDQLNVTPQDNKMSFESEPLDALDKLTHHNKNIENTDTGIFFIRTESQLNSFELVSVPLKNKLIILSRSGNKKRDDQFDIQIRIKTGKPELLDWTRQWEVEITAPHMQTPEMAKILQKLTNFNTQRQSRPTRLACPEPMIL